MTHTPSRKIARGAALPVALILLGVLTIVATTAVSLSSRERVNASAYSRMDSIYACANTATAKFWAELGAQGNALLAPRTSGSPAISSITLPDGTRLSAPAHFDTLTSGPSTGSTALGGAASSPGPADPNNGTATVNPGVPYTFTVHCIDANGRELEVEIGVSFNL